MRIYIILILFIMGCSSYSNNQEKSLKTQIIFKENQVQSINLNSKKIEFEKIINPEKIALKGSKLFVLENIRTNVETPFIHIIETRNWSYFKSKGKVGFGPMEISSATFFEPGFSDSTFFTYSSRDKALSEFSLNDTSLLAIRQIKQPDNFFSVVNLYLLAEDRFIGISVNDENKLIEFNTSGERISGYGNWEPVLGHSELSNFNLFELNSGWFKTNESKDVFVKASIKRDKLEIFNYKDKNFISVLGPDLELPPFQIRGPVGNRSLDVPISNPYRYRDVAITDKKIFALYGGISESQYRESGELARKIYVFDLQGNPEFILKLDRSIKGIAIDNIHKKIYGITTDASPGIAIFDIPKEVF